MLFFVSVLFGLLIGCKASQCNHDICHTQSGNELKFFVLGDFGGLHEAPYYTRTQKQVATAMEKLGSKMNTSFQLELGDNFYTSGVANVDDTRFQTTFENVYPTNYSTFNKPWYIVAGNHDWLGNASAQIAYSSRSQRWIFPKYYYSIRYEFARGIKADFVMIDTILLAGMTLDKQHTSAWDLIWDRVLSIICTFCVPIQKQFERILNFFAYPVPQSPEDPIMAEEQWRWIESTLRNSDADYLFVAGHYPIYSCAAGGPIKILVDRLDDLLFRYNVTAYFAGHDHNLQHLQVTKSDQSMHYVVSGQASRSDSSTKHMADVPKNSLKFRYPKTADALGGFLIGNLTASSGNFTFFDSESNNLYNFRFSPRNN